MNLLLRQAWSGLRLLLAFTVILGVAYPVAVFAVGRFIPAQSDGSYVTDAQGRVVGSALIGQAFEGPEWFQSRPSAAGAGYDSLASGGSNLAADNPDLVSVVAHRKAAVAARDGADPASVPADAVTASGSGLDPDISPEYAMLQVARVAASRALDPARVRALVEEQTQGRLLGFIGEPRVNVLALNLALERAT
ncbi:MAG: potassium-transporting ATPase subunit KdpC [Actinomycetales bacterium]|nr:potassium-transporting ATPase subunit KdpC [Actinomycetales bacterium]